MGNTRGWEDCLARFGWLAHCRPGFRDFVLAHLRHGAVAAGTEITHAGDDEGGFYALVSGQGHFVATIGGEQATISLAGYPGTWWGQGPLVGLPRVGYAIARSDCRFASLPLPTLRRRLADVPEDWEAIALTWSDLFLMAAGAQADLLIPSHLRRLAATLLRLGGNRHRRYPVDVPETFFLTQEELAGAMGLARNAAGRLLRRLEADGLVNARYGRVTILDPARLSHLADGDQARE